MTVSIPSVVLLSQPFGSVVAYSLVFQLRQCRLVRLVLDPLRIWTWIPPHNLGLYLKRETLQWFVDGCGLYSFVLEDKKRSPYLETHCSRSRDFLAVPIEFLSVVSVSWSCAPPFRAQKYMFNRKMTSTLFWTVICVGCSIFPSFFFTLQRPLV